MYTKLLFLILAGSVQFSAGAKILAFFPFPAKSHHNVFHPVIESLAAKGHQITFFTPIKLAKPSPNVKEIHIKNILADLFKSVKIDEMVENSVITQAIQFGSMGAFIGNEIYSMEEFQNLMSTKESFDLVLMESLFMQEVQSVLMHRFGAIGVDLLPHGDSSWYNELAGLPDNPAYMVDARTSLRPNMNFWERIENTYTAVVSTIIGYYYLRKQEDTANTYFKYPGSESRPTLAKLVSDKALILLNSHHSTGYAFPKAPHVKEVGGLNIRDNKPLPKDLQVFMDGAKDGVIYFSFGSNLNMTEMTKEGIADSLIKVFGELKQRVLWKWDSDLLPKASANVKFSKWFPQQDILAHKNVKLFITHGGYLSISEAVNFGVPLIGVPIFADQPKNMQHVVDEGYGVLLERKNMTETSIRWAINEVLTNSKYENVVTKKSELFRDRPMKPLDEAVYWIEYVLKHKNVLQPKSVHLCFCVLHQLDVIGVFVITCILLKKILCKICHCICCRKSCKKTAKVTKKKKD